MFANTTSLSIVVTTFLTLVDSSFLLTLVTECLYSVYLILKRNHTVYGTKSMIAKNNSDLLTPGVDLGGTGVGGGIVSGGKLLQV